jgi:hypothetical protein
MILARRRTAPPMAPDPVLNGVLGRLALAAGEPAQALGYLQQADGPGVADPQRAAADLALAATREQLGDFEAARQALGRLSGDKLTAREAMAAMLERARLLLGTNPAAAIQLVQPLAAQEWETATILAQAQSLLGNAAAARDAAARAWVAAAEAPPQDYAPQRVALVRAALAGAAGDRPALLAMLNTGTAAGSEVDAALAKFLPVCGERGIEPTDSVTFTLFEGSNGADELRPVAASRPAAVQPFLDALAGRNMLQHAGEGPGGTLITVRCRSFPDDDYDTPPRTAAPWSDFLARHGLYQTITRDGSLDDINTLSAELETMARAVGDDDPRLIPLRVQLAHWLEVRAQSDGDVEAWQVAELQRKAATAIAKLGGGAGAYLTEEDLATTKAVEAAPTPAEALPMVRTAMLRRVSSLPLDIAYTQTRIWLDGDKDLPDETRRSAIETLLQRFGPKSTDPRRRALIMRLGSAERGRDIQAARASWSAAGLAGDICRALDEPPRVQEHKIVDEDYPSDMLQFAIEGKSIFDATIGPAGQISAARLILSTPTLLFDDIVAAKLAGFKMSPPVSGGAPRSCRGFIQTIRWKMPDANQGDQNPQPPPFRAPEPAST